MPIYSLFLPLIIWAVSPSHPYRRSHARQAFSFQCVFLAVWVVLVALLAMVRVGALVMLAVLMLGLLLEVPQVVRAMTGKPPLRIVPVEVLPV